MFFTCDVLRTPEHEMLEQVCEAGAAFALILGTDVIPDLEVDHRPAVVFMHDHSEAVGQLGGSDLEFRRAVLRAQREGEEGNDPEFHEELNSRMGIDNRYFHFGFFQTASSIHHTRMCCSGPELGHLKCHQERTGWVQKVTEKRGATSRRGTAAWYGKMACTHAILLALPSGSVSL